MSASNGASRATVHEESEIRVADVAYDPKAAAALEIAHRKGGAFWWSILLALVLLSEQTALAVNLLNSRLAYIFAASEKAGVCVVCEGAGQSSPPIHAPK